MQEGKPWKLGIETSKSIQNNENKEEEEEEFTSFNLS